MADFSHHEPCPSCGSRDNLARYSDGSAYCFGCGHHEKGSDEVNPPAAAASAPPDLVHGDFEPLSKRQISLDTCRKYSYRVGFKDTAPCQIADYYDEKGRRVAQKLRFPDKSFRWVGDPKQALLFGHQLWRDGGRRLVITEGEIDALSVAQAMGLRWPVVSVPNGAQGAKKDLAKHVEWLESFDQVVLMFDNDEPGRLAAVECAELLSPGKACIARLPLKDANDMLVGGQVRQLVDAAWQAKPYRPDGVFEAIELLDRVLDPPGMGLPYPWPCVNTLTHGMRRSELVTWTAGTGIGKSQVVREVIRHLHLEHGEKVGIIALEESVAKTALAQISLEVGAPLHLPDVYASVGRDRIEAAAQKVLRGLYVYDHFGSITSDAILPKIRFFAKGLGVRWVVLDHISIMVSGSATEGDERKKIDELVTRLRSLVQELDIGLHIVSHLRKLSNGSHEEGGQVSLVDLRGSGAIAHVSDMVIGLERNQQAEADAKHFTNVRVLKNRFSGETGLSGRLVYNPATGRISDGGEVTAMPPVQEGEF